MSIIDALMQLNEDDINTEEYTSDEISRLFLRWANDLASICGSDFNYMRFQDAHSPQGNPIIFGIDAKDNLGFEKANNLGAKNAKGRYLCFLNTDTLLINNAIYELKKYLEFKRILLYISCLRLKIIIDIQLVEGII